MFAFLTNNPEVSSVDTYAVKTYPTGTTTSKTSSYSLKVEDPSPI